MNKERYDELLNEAKTFWIQMIKNRPNLRDQLKEPNKAGKVTIINAKPDYVEENGKNN